MSIIWFILMIFSITILIFTSPNLVITEMLNSATNTINLSIKLLAIYSIWLGLLELVEKTGLSKKLSKLLSPIINKLFKTNNEKAKEYIAINISANILGLGNASTPSGIKAMRELDSKTGKINFSMSMLFLINVCAIQFLPTTIISLRDLHNSTNSTSIVLPIILSSLITCIIGIALLFIFHKFKRTKK